MNTTTNTTANDTKQQTPAQRERQHSCHRRGGKYAKMNPCQVCGKGAGADYFSFTSDDNSVHYYCICGKCADKLEDAEAAKR